MTAERSPDFSPEGKPPETERGGQPMARREFLKRPVLAAAALGLALVSQGDRARHIQGEPESKQEEEEELSPLSERVFQPKEYLTGQLAGRKLNDLYIVYTGLLKKVKVPEKFETDFQYLLQGMWKQKGERSDNNRVVVQTGRRLRMRYQQLAEQEKLHFISLPEYIGEANKVIQVIARSIDWETVAEIKRLKREDLELVRKICLSVTGKDLVAYALTELMPSKEGKLNVDVLEFLLRNAGREYMESIPALYDPKTSFGPYQFTEYALFDTPAGKRGASVINGALPEAARIPGSVSKLRGEDHHKAAYLFMIDNFCNLVGSLRYQTVRVKDRKTRKINAVRRERPNADALLILLERELVRDHKDLIIYAATAHHGPGVALEIAHRWLNNQARKPYKLSAGRIYRSYAQKTEANLFALGREK